jgi:hypothetical protein
LALSLSLKGRCRYRDDDYATAGCAIPANPGANPNLTITAPAELRRPRDSRLLIAVSYWPRRSAPKPSPN